MSPSSATAEPKQNKKQVARLIDLQWPHTQITCTVLMHQVRHSLTAAQQLADDILLQAPVLQQQSPDVLTLQLLLSLMQEVEC